MLILDLCEVVLIHTFSFIIKCL